MSPISWWARKARRFGRHLVANVSPQERRAVAAWTRPAELALFDAMHVADRRHGLDVVAHLRAAGVADRDVLAAGLLHDCAPMTRLREHAWRSAELCEAAGLPPRAVALIREQEHPGDPEYGAAFLAADEAS